MLKSWDQVKMNNQIWSPWRMDYIMNHEKGAECVFCAALQQEDGQGNLIITRGKNVFCILNRYPYTSGHVMIVPFAHLPGLDDLPAATRSEMMEMAAQALQVLRILYQPDGFNLGINMGEAAGAGVTSHVHLHVLPRWSGDTNFMSSVAQTRVLPEGLDESYSRVRLRWTRLFASSVSG